MTTITEAVSREVAQQEIDKLLSKRRMRPKQITEKQESIDTMVDAIMYGDLVYDELANTLTQKLLFPLENANITELTYALRINDNMLKPNLQNVKSTDGLGMLNAYIAALTGKAPSLTALLDSADKSVAVAITSLFL